MSEERLEELMVKYVDGLATPSERDALLAVLAKRPDLRMELDAHLALKATTDGWVERLLLDTVEDGWQAKTVVRAERAIGVSLVVGGASILVGFGLVEMWLSTAPLWVKGGTAAVVAGLSILLISAVRWRHATLKSDKYTDVVR